MVVFNGSIKIRVVEAKDLQPTEWSTRLSSLVGGPQKPGVTSILDPYVNVDVDEYHVGQTATKPKTSAPKWDEMFESEVHNGQQIGFTIFHDCAIPPDDFIANCRISFDDLSEKQYYDFWVDLEPSGRLHIIIDLLGSVTQEEGTSKAKDRQQQRVS